MTPVADTPDTGDAGIFSEIGDVLSEAGVGATEETTEEQPEQQLEATETIPPGEAPTKPEEVPGQQPSPPGEGPSYQLTEDGNHYLVPKTELAPLQGYKTYAEQVQGWFPTAADAQAAYQHFSYDQQMRADYLHGQEADLDAFIKHWAGADYYANPQMQQMYQQRFSQMAQRIPGVLKGLDQNAYYTMAEGLVQDHIAAAYDYASQTGDPADLIAAQRLDWGFTGQYKTELPKVDPSRPLLEQQTRQAQELAQREATLLSRDWKSYESGTVEGPKWQAFNAEIDKTLAPVKDKYDPAEFDAIRLKISNDLIAKLNADQEFSRIHIAQKRAIESGYANLWKKQMSADELKPTIQARQNHLMTQVRRLLPSLAAPLLSKAAQRKVAQSKPNQKQQSTPARRPNQPAVNGEERRGSYNIHDDPEWLSNWKTR